MIFNFLKLFLEDNRKVMSGMSELFPKVVKLVHSHDEAIKTFSVRTLANLCFNHGKLFHSLQLLSAANCRLVIDENRTHVDQAHGIEPVVQELSTSNPKLLRVVCGCIANLCSTNGTCAPVNITNVPQLNINTYRGD